MEESYEKFLVRRRKQLAKYARLRGLGSNYAEDFASEALIKIMEGRKALTHQLFIDFLRENFTTKSGYDRTTSELYFQDGDDKPFGTSSSPTVKFENEFLLQNLETEKRVMFLLKHKWGLENVEIAYLFGSSESWICIKMKAIEEHLKKRSNRDTI